MSTRIKPLATVAVAAALIALAISSNPPGSAYADSSARRAQRQCPLVLDLNQGIRAEIVDIHFTDELQATYGRSLSIPEDKKDKIRFGLVTIKITKPAGQRLTLAAADLTLHYYHGDRTEVAPCEGISFFSTNDNVDRLLDMPRHAGPGFLKQTTGAKSTKAGEVYIDATFFYMEPDTSEVWLCIAQPTSGQPFPAGGWTP